MTDNQFNQLFDLLTELYEGIQRIENGQQKIENTMLDNNAVVDSLAKDNSKVPTAFLTNSRKIIGEGSLKKIKQAI